MKKLNWICGDDKMPDDFDKLYAIIELYTIKQENQLSTGLILLVSKLDRIDRRGYVFSTKGSGTIDDKEKIVFRLKEDASESTIKHDEKHLFYWSEINFGEYKEELESLNSQKEELDRKIQELEIKNKESMIELEVDIFKDLKEKLTSLENFYSEKNFKIKNWAYNDLKEF
jgi:DNA repair exonuclease SbcCD ATPase subunit